jgi:CarD family transcriptional regulator
MNLAVGDVVVYGTHGMGRVTGRRKQVVAGSKQEVVVLELQDGLTVTLPVERALEQLRPPASEADLRAVQQALRAERELSQDTWLVRRREMQAKLADGRPVQLAEIVGEGAQRERRPTTSGKTTKLSGSEKELFTRARQLLSDEVALARGIGPEAADDWIEKQLDRA